MAFRWLIPVVLTTAFFAAPTTSLAQDKGLFFKFSTDPNGAPGGVPETQPKGLEIRPNTGQPWYLFVYNQTGDSRDVVVQVTSDNGRQIFAEAKFKLADVRDKPIRITLAKPAPPMPAAAPPMAPAPAAVVANPMAAAAPPPAPPPPGIELKLTPNKENNKRGFVFRVKAFVDGKDTPREDFQVDVTIQQPTDYIVPVPQKIEYFKKRRDILLSASFKSNEKFSGTTPCPIELSFPPQSVLKADALREGVYHREFTGTNQVARLYSKNLPLNDQSKDNGKFNISIDGVPRAYVYTHAFADDTDDKNAKVEQVKSDEIRFMEGESLAPPVEIVTRPRIVPLHLEADTALPDASLTVGIYQLPGNELVESIGRDSTRERQVWLDGGAMEGGLLVTTHVGDWMIPLNVRDLRGRYKLRAALFGGDKVNAIAKFDRDLIVDDTKPEEIRVEILPGHNPAENPPKHMRNKPLPVRVIASDPESKIVKVVAFFGKPGPDGKLPDGEKTEAVAPKLGADGWIAQLPLPADKKGDQDITVVATNGVGLSESTTVRIQLIDPPTGGTIKGTVSLTPKGKGMAGVPVVLRDNADFKEKGSAVTNDKGEFIIEDVPPGSYRVFAARPDSGVGTKGDAHARVQAGKTTEVQIILTRRP